MSTKDAFFQKLQSSSNAQKEQAEALKKAIDGFQVDTAKLLMMIKDWFASTSVKTSIQTVSLFEENQRFEMGSLRLENGDKSLTITPVGLYYGGVTGVLEVKIRNPSRAPMETKFNIHWQDSISGLSGWVIVKGIASQKSPQRVAFDQEAFFAHIMDFA